MRTAKASIDNIVSKKFKETNTCHLKIEVAYPAIEEMKLVKDSDELDWKSIGE